MKKLAELRKARGLSQKELAERIAVSRTTIVNWENGLSKPNWQHRFLISIALDCNVQDLQQGGYIMGRAYLGPKDKANAKRAEAFHELFGVVEKYTYMRNYDATDLMKVVGFSRTVYYDRRKLPERLRFGELMNLIQTLKIPYSEIEPLMQVILSY